MARTDVIKPYLFASIDARLSNLRKSGVNIISFGVGDPDSPPPPELRRKLSELVLAPDMHNYSPYEGTERFRQAAADYMKRRYGLTFNASSEVVGLIGSKEGIGNVFIAYTEEGTINLVPSLAYPIPATLTGVCGGIVHSMPARSSNGFLPDFDEIPRETAKKARLLYLNYPNNPTGVSADFEFYEKALNFAVENDLIIIHDNAYEEIWYTQKPISMFELDGAKERVVEFHSLSKMFNITGWRLAFACGNAELLKPLKTMKTNMDSGQFKPLQHAAAWGLDELIDDFGASQRKTYSIRLARMRSALEGIGCEVPTPGGTFFLWGRVPSGMTSAEFTEMLLEKYGIFITPGHMFGAEGEGFFRASLTVSDALLDQALARIDSGRIL
ncbi:aminotransferase class I/II-fold pyridoxal phosphate-dependent enzyme [Myxococcota bacterium]|nr:aminotransferase class I/II-fold pyridoxal phosphate-dependent enzyme [Myxococcota bacterium]MBU1382014.1 aminotransferase class I/II-fold pyridoxal phosphate-dependent enzyme [Myxococcota bacterium]MBU1497649.1 aminotransferase class I/II-fold pyridoxal phosphate-dependent enzyme [Myxococcota bacterium]